MSGHGVVAHAEVTRAPVAPGAGAGHVVVPGAGAGRFGVPRRAAVAGPAAAVGGEVRTGRVVVAPEARGRETATGCAGSALRAAVARRVARRGAARAAGAARSARFARDRCRDRRRDRGSASIEFLGFLPVLLLVALAAVQLGLAAYAVQQAGTAARAAARTASLDEAQTSPAAAGLAAMSGWLADGTDVGVTPCGDGRTRATATVDIPSVLPGVSFGSAERSATMPCDDG